LDLDRFGNAEGVIKGMRSTKQRDGLGCVGGDSSGLTDVARTDAPVD